THPHAASLAAGAFGADAGNFAGLEMAPTHAAVLHFEIDEIGIGRITAADVAIAAEDGDPILVDRPGATFQTNRRPAPGAIVLKAAEDPVGALVVDGDVIELAERERVEMVPVVGAVVADVEPAIRADEHMQAVFRIDPHRVAVRMDTLAGVSLERLAAVL